MVASELILVHLVLEGCFCGFSGHLLIISVLVNSVWRLIVESEIIPRPRQNPHTGPRS